MGFFTNEELDSLRIEDMILHVVSGDPFEPQVARDVEHPEFFIDRIKDTDVAPVFEFDPHSVTKARLESVAARRETFEQGAQSLSREFARLHDGASRAGAFFVFELSCHNPRVRLYSLIKYDYQQVIEQGGAEGGNLLRLIVQAFVAQKRAVQKSALVRVVDGVAEITVSARDRVKQAPDIGDYFANFLAVARNHTDEELNRKVVDVIRQTLVDVQHLLPDRNVPRAFRRAKAALRERVEITERAVVEAVVAAAEAQDDEAVRTDLDVRVRRKLRSAKIDGLAFRPDRAVLGRPALRRVRTTEGVVLTYPDDADGAVVHRQPSVNGGEVITIRTRQVMEDQLVRDGSRAAG